MIDVDLRYIDYENAAPLWHEVADGGLGWQSIFAVALGGQYTATDKLSLRSGYLYNTNPIAPRGDAVQRAGPGLHQHMFSVGASYNITEDITASLAWVHHFRNAIEGPVLQIPGQRIKLDAQMDSIVAGLNVQFGTTRKGPDNTVSTGEIAPVPLQAPPAPPTSVPSYAPPIALPPS